MLTVEIRDNADNVILELHKPDMTMADLDNMLRKFAGIHPGVYASLKYTKKEVKNASSVYVLHG